MEQRMSADLSRGACAGKADQSYAVADVFYPEPGTGRPTKDPYQEAKEICARCPLTAECLQDALTDTVQWGYRAGMTPEQRQALKSKRGRPTNRFNPTPADLEMRVALHAQGLNDREIAAKLGVVDKTITTWRNRNGLPANQTPTRAHSPEQNLIKKQAYDAGCPDSVIATMAGVKVGAIRKWRLRMGYPVNPARERISA